MTVVIDKKTVNSLARQMATDAGYDPNERVNGAHPRWTEYLTSARDQIKAEIEGGAPQPLQYRDRPLHVFGEHEDATIKQMRHCMEFGQVHGAALMPDGHKGYSQAVGGVIAYKDQISVSGVGFDIGCFTADTRIITLEGQTPSFQEIEDQQVWILACGPFSHPVPAKGTCRKTRANAYLVRVNLSNGESVRCTPDHLFMLGDGTYQRADALAPKQALMHLREDVSVLSVEALPEREDVYCLTVPGLNNFALAAGVFVHNCGNLAVELDTPFDDIQGKLPTILQDIRRQISFGVGRVNNTPVEHPLFDDRDAWIASGMMHFREQAVAQLGTVGSGNHYVDVFADERNKVWIGVHFGSRGLGHKTATLYLKKAGGRDGMDVPPTVLDVNSDLGTGYLAGMDLAGKYAYAGREWVVEQVRKIIGGNVVSSVHNHHNYAFRENHGGEDLWVVRKGATPAFPGQRGFVGGSMGDDAVILEGIDGYDARRAYHSTVHGAGRVFGRMEAKRRFSRAQMDAWLQKRGVMVSGGDIDESPMAYRRLPDVLAHQQGMVRVLHTLRPVLVLMAGDGEFDPYKD